MPEPHTSSSSEGELRLPAVAMNHTAGTDVWAGTLSFDGTMLQSALWLNRHTALNSNGGTFRSIKADYNATIRPGGPDSQGTITTDSLILGFGSRMIFDIYESGTSADCITTRILNIETKLTGNWLTYGPKYLAPVLEIVNHGTNIADGDYLIMDGLETVKGKLTDIIIEGAGTTKTTSLRQDGDKLYLVISGVRQASDIVWTGATSADWQFGGDANFRLTASTGEGAQESFVSGDIVRFTDESTKLNVNIKGDIEADSVIVDSKKNYTFKGTGSLVGATTLVKRGTGNLTIQTDNTYTGGTRISEGTLTVTTLSNANQATGNLGGVNTAASKFVIENGAVLATSGVVTQGSPMQMAGEAGGVINNAGDFVVNKAISGTTLTKRGGGWMKMNIASTLQRLVVAEGTVQCVNANKVANTVEFQGGSYLENTGSGFTLYVPKGKSGSWNSVDKATYTNKVTGEGTLTIYCSEIKGSGWFATRTQLAMDFSQFQGTIKATGRTDDEGARWTLNTAKGMPDGTLQIADGLTVQNTGKTFAIGRVAGDKGSLGGYASFSNNGGSGANTWQIGNDTDWAWGGKVTANSILNKVGTGKVTLKGASDHSGATNINAGEIKITSTATLGTGVLTVKNGATLSGVTAANKDLTNASVTVSNGGTLLVGASETATTGVMRFSGKNVTFASGSHLCLGVAKADAGTATGGTSLQNIGRLTMNATISIYVPHDHNLNVGDVVTLWQATSVSGTPTLENKIIRGGLMWDDSQLAQGRLTVVANPDGIVDTPAYTPQQPNEIYTIDGRRIATPRRGQVVVVRGKKALIK